MRPEDRYRLDSLLARGGMAEVWRATDLSTEPPRDVAVKRILPELTDDPALVRMFLDEATITRRLSHRAIVPLLDFGVLADRPFHTLALIDGADAGAVLEKQTLPVDLALHVAAELASALAHAHDARDGDGAQLGIVHRDVSPANVLLARDGRVFLTDFGIALGRDRRERTATGHTKGKAAYMSPEQTLGAKVDARADVFGLGCTLYALCRGESPLAAPDAMAGLLAGEPVALDGSLPDDVREIVSKAIAPRAVARYPSMAAMEAACREALARRRLTDARPALAEWLAGVVIREATPPQRRPTLANSRKKRWPYALAALVAFAVIAATLGARRFSTAVASSDATQRVPATQSARDAGKGALRDLVWVAVAADAGADASGRTTRDTRRPARAPAADAPESPPRPALRVEPPSDVSSMGSAWGVVNFRVPRDARVVLDGGRVPFRDVVRGHPCDTTGLCHLAVGQYELDVVELNGNTEHLSLCVSEGTTLRAFSPLPPSLGCN